MDRNFAVDSLWSVSYIAARRRLDAAGSRNIISYLPSALCFQILGKNIATISNI